MIWEYIIKWTGIQGKIYCQQKISKSIKNSPNHIHYKQEVTGSTDAYSGPNLPPIPVKPATCSG